MYAKKFFRRLAPYPTRVEYLKVLHKMGRLPALPSIIWLAWTAQLKSIYCKYKEEVQHKPLASCKPLINSFEINQENQKLNKIKIIFE
jgi:hypothetical protein